MTTHDADSNERFWAERGAAADVSGHSLTLMATHQRYVDYVHERELSFLLQHLPRDAHILDAGCGSGRLSLALAPHAREILAFDFSASLIDHALRCAHAGDVRNVRFTRARLDAPFPAGKFDAVLLSGVLNYLGDDAAAHALAHAVNALLPGGMLFLRNVCGVHRRHFRPASTDNAPTIHRTAQEYRTMLAKHPVLEVQEDRYLFPPLCLPNMVYYHVLPKGLRDHPRVAGVLDAWFVLERRTAEARLGMFSKAYAAIMRLLGKPTAFHVLVARRRI